MQQILAHYAVEVALVCLGAVAAALEAILAHNSDIALIIGLLSFLLALAVVDIRQEIARQLGAVLVDRQLVDRIPDPGWREDAKSEIEQARVKYEGWCSGLRQIGDGSSLKYQVTRLATTKASIRTIHVGLDSEALGMWDDPQRGFARMVDAYRTLDDGIQRRRILVLAEDDPDVSAIVRGSRTIISDRIREVCARQLGPRPDGLGFELRIAWRRSSDRELNDLLIIDDKESCSIQSFGHGRFGNLEVCVNRALVQEQIDRFEDLWTDSVPAQHCLELSAGHD